MALAIEQYTPRDEDRWTLDEAFHYLTVTLGYTKERALDEMEQQILAGHLVVQVHKVVDGKPQGEPEYLRPNKKHKLDIDLGWIRPRALKWGADRCTVYRQRVLELWPLRPPVSDKQPEDKAGLDRSAAQRRPAKASKSDGGAAAPPPRAAKGPVRGEIDRFGDADRALFPEIKRLMKSQRLTSTEAVRQIPEDKLAGRGTLDSRIRRVSNRFRREKL
jgi:hypothetical protein